MGDVKADEFPNCINSGKIKIGINKIHQLKSAEIIGQKWRFQISFHLGKLSVRTDIVK